MASRALRNRRRIRKNDDIGFQSFCPMYRHYAHFVPPALHVALDLGIPGLEPMQKACQRGRVQALVRKREAEELVDGMVKFRTQARQQTLATSRRAQYLRKIL